MKTLYKAWQNEYLGSHLGQAVTTHVWTHWGFRIVQIYQVNESWCDYAYLNNSLAYAMNTCF